MSGRHFKPIKDEHGRTLVAQVGNHTIRIGKDKTNNRYVLFRDKKAILRRQKLSDISAEFEKIVGKDNLISIPLEQIKQEESNEVVFREKIRLEDGYFIYEKISDKEREELHKKFKKNPHDTIFLNYQIGSKHDTQFKLPIEAVINLFLEILHKDKYKVASIAKMPIFAKLDEIDPSIFKNNITITLEDILNAYNNRVKKPPSEKSKEEAEDWLNEFIEIIRIKTGKKPNLISDFTKENVIAYSNEIYQVATIKDYKYKCKWLSVTQVKYLEFYKKYPKKKWYRDRVTKLHTLFTNYLKVNMLSDEPEALILSLFPLKFLFCSQGKTYFTPHLFSCQSPDLMLFEARVFDDSRVPDGNVFLLPIRPTPSTGKPSSHFASV